MTITRLASFAAETQFVDVILQSGTTAPAISNAKAKTGTYSYRTSATVNNFGYPCSATTVRAGYWLNHNGVSSSTTRAPFAYIAVGLSYYQIVYTANTGLWELLAGFNVSSLTNNVANSVVNSALFTPNVWTHIGLAAKCSSSGGYVSFYMDGVKILTYTGDTRVYKSSSAALEAANITGVYIPNLFGTGWTSFAYVDDFYIDSAVGEADAAPPSRRFLWSPASGAGSFTQWTPLASTNVSNVDDAAAPDDDTTYNKALSSGLIDTYATTNVTVPADHTVVAVIPIAHAKKTDAAVATTLKLAAYDGANYVAGSAKTLTSAYASYQEYMATKPAGGAWATNGSDVNSCEFGVESAGSY